MSSNIRDRAPVPGKHTNTESLESGALGPTPKVAGKRSETEALPPATAAPLPRVRPPIERASEASHVLGHDRALRRQR